MSSFSDNHSPSSSQFLPPQSAQARGSLFGGPSSDGDLPPSSLPGRLRPRRSIFGGFSSEYGAQESERQPEQMYQEVPDQEEDELDVILRERPLAAYYGSDGDSFQGSSDDEAKKTKKRAPKRGLESEITETQPPKDVAPQPTYVLHRGVDLPPGVKRPNRWTGHPSTYRNVIAAERGVFDSMMTTRARNLSGHLYDAFAKRQYPNQELDEFGDTEDSDDEEAKAFRKKWIAWPMHAPGVPRADEHVRRRLDGLDTYRIQPDSHPSAELEECIIATMMKTAKERFQARGWEGDDIDSPKEENEADPNAMMTDADEKAEKDENTQSDEKEEEENKEEEEQEGVEVADDMWEDFKPASRKPVVQADDDLSHNKLRPLSRIVISQLDELLTGLHHSLKYRAKDIDSSDDSATDTDTDSEDEELRQRTEQKDQRDPSRGRKRTREDQHSHPSSLDRPSNSGSPPKSEVEADDMSENYQEMSDYDEDPEKIMERLPLRDWSEVMGIASMIGLPPSAIRRASKRCADLFEQDMTFRRFHEGRIMKLRRVRGDIKRFEYGYAESESESESERKPRRRRRNHVRDSPGPAKSLHRDISMDATSVHRDTSMGSTSVHRDTSMGATSQNRDSSMAATSQHRDTSMGATSQHRNSSVGTASRHRETSAGAAPSKPRKSHSPSSAKAEPILKGCYGKDPTRKSLYSCSISGCKRSVNGFSRLWNYKEHVKKKHPMEYDSLFPDPKKQ